MLLLTLLSVNGCAKNGPVIESGCEWSHFIWLSPDDRLTPPTESAIIGHNEARERVCGSPRV